MSLSFSARASASSAVLFRQVGEESVLLNIKTNNYLGLDPVGTRMWMLVTTADSIQTAYETLLTEYNVDSDTLRRDLNDLLGSLLEHELIEIQSKEGAGPASS